MSEKKLSQLQKELPLGKPTKYEHKYTPSLLKAVPRSWQREALNLPTTTPLPFHGKDIWTLYELSWLNTNGLPQVAIAYVTVDCSSINLIESKSFKLYLMSFMQTQFDSWDSVQQHISTDLSHCAQGHVTVDLYPLSHFSGHMLGDFPGECIDNQSIKIDSYDFNPHYLSDALAGPLVTEVLVSHLLKSNCLITNQPDWASIQISYSGQKINREALLRYLISFRQHNEFHEQCVERIFIDLLTYYHPEKLTVYARYTRRGGLDINPYRSNYTFTPALTRLVRQ